MGGGRDRAIALAGAKIQRPPLAHPMNLRLYRGCCFSIEMSTVGLVGLYRSGGKILLSQRERRRLEIFSRVKQRIVSVAGAGRFLAQPPHFGTKEGSRAQPRAKACTVNAWSINGLPPLMRCLGRFCIGEIFCGGCCGSCTPSLANSNCCSGAGSI